MPKVTACVQEFRAHPESYRFALDDPRWRAFLDEHGFVVVGGLIANSQPYVDEIWSCVEELAGGRLRRSQPATLQRAASWPFMLHGGMIQYLAHARVQWELRAQVAPVFAALHGCQTDELATSFDGLCLMSGARRYEPRADLSFAHTDQSPRRMGRWSVQGLVNLVASDHESGGLVVIPGSHRAHHDFFASRGIDHKDDWYKFSDQEKQDPLFRDSLKVCGDAGDFLMWDSRTFHCNTVPRRPVDRICTYVCMLPAAAILPHIVVKRRAALEQRRCSTHHPGDGFKLFPQLPRFAGAAERVTLLAALDRLQSAPLTPLQRNLARVDLA